MGLVVGVGDEAREPGRTGRGCALAVLARLGCEGQRLACGRGQLTQAPCVSSSGRYAVFGLGSSMYPQFCAFAHDIDQKLSQLGASQIAPTGEGDELSGQEEAFRDWAVQTFKVSSQPELPHSTGREAAVHSCPGHLCWASWVA